MGLLSLSSTVSWSVSYVGPVSAGPVPSFTPTRGREEDERFDIRDHVPKRSPHPLPTHTMARIKCPFTTSLIVVVVSLVD